MSSVGGPDRPQAVTRITAAGFPRRYLSAHVERTVGRSTLWKGLFGGADAVLRIFVGAVSAILLVALLRGELVKLSVGDGSILNNTHGLVVVAFIAGFTERLVSNFLSGLSLSGRSAPQARPVAPTPKSPADETTVTGATTNTGGGQRPRGAGQQPAPQVPAQPVNEDSELLDEPDEEESDASGGDDEASDGTGTSNAAEPVG